MSLNPNEVHRPIPEWMKVLPIRDISIEVNEEKIKEGPKCPSCGTQTVRSTIRYIAGRKFIVRAESAPGYRCPEDGRAFISREVLDRVLPEARRILEEQGDIGGVQSIDAVFEPPAGINLKLRPSKTL